VPEKPQKSMKYKKILKLKNGLISDFFIEVYDKNILSGCLIKKSKKSDFVDESFCTIFIIL